MGSLQKNRIIRFLMVLTAVVLMILIYASYYSNPTVTLPARIHAAAGLFSQNTNDDLNFNKNFNLIINNDNSNNNNKDDHNSMYRYMQIINHQLYEQQNQQGPGAENYINQDNSSLDNKYQQYSPISNLSSPLSSSLPLNGDKISSFSSSSNSNNNNNNLDVAINKTNSSHSSTIKVLSGQIITLDNKSTVSNNNNNNTRNMTTSQLLSLPFSSRVIMNASSSSPLALQKYGPYLNASSIVNSPNLSSELLITSVGSGLGGSDTNSVASRVLKDTGGFSSLKGISKMLSPSEVIKKNNPDSLQLPSSSSSSSSPLSLSSPSSASSPTSQLPLDPAKGIPTASIYETGHLDTNPQLCPEEGEFIRLFICITSAPNHREARLAIRQTWGHFGTRRDVGIAFILGKTTNHIIEDSLTAENYLYGDIIRGNFIDSYNNLTLKTISALEWIDRKCPLVKYVLKTDDDMFINVPKLLNFIDKHHNEKNVIYGRLAKKWKPIRNKKSKYYVSPGQFSSTIFPQFTTGPAYLMSSNIIHDLYLTALKQTYLKLEDVFTTGIVAQLLNIKRIHINEFLNRRIAFNPCNIRKSISVHMIKSNEQFDLWKKLLDTSTKCK